MISPNSCCVNCISAKHSAHLIIAYAFLLGMMPKLNRPPSSSQTYTEAVDKAIEGELETFEIVCFFVMGR